MSDEFGGFAPPPFNPGEALRKLGRELRELGLAEREGRFERRGMQIAKAAVDGMSIRAAIARKPARNSPEWQPRALKSSAEVRDFVADLKKKLAGWGDRDD